MNSLEVKNIFEITNTLKLISGSTLQKKFFQMEQIGMENIQNKIQDKKNWKKIVQN